MLLMEIEISAVLSKFSNFSFVISDLFTIHCRKEAQHDFSHSENNQFSKFEVVSRGNWGSGRDFLDDDENTLYSLRKQKRFFLSVMPPTYTLPY